MRVSFTKKLKKKDVALGRIFNFSYKACKSNIRSSYLITNQKTQGWRKRLKKVECNSEFDVNDELF